jgi:putative Ca2+/H+ antiporter (TMEM165/GDT1 family)
MNGMDWSAFITTFGLVFVAELGDKTQLAVVTQTCKHRRPWAVFLGASLALTAVTALGVVGGRVLGQIVLPSLLRGIAALAFIVMGILVGQQAARARPGQSLAAACDDTEDQEVEAGCASNGSSGWKAFGSTLGLLFLAELGDKTQLTVLGLAGRYGSPWLVFLAGAAALTAITALGVVGGQGLCRLIPERLVLWASAAAFVVMGLLMGWGVL